MHSMAVSIGFYWVPFNSKNLNKKMCISGLHLPTLGVRWRSTEIIFITCLWDMQLISSQTSPIPVTTKTTFWQMVQFNQRPQPPMAWSAFICHTVAFWSNLSQLQSYAHLQQRLSNLSSEILPFKPMSFSHLKLLVESGLYYMQLSVGQIINHFLYKQLHTFLHTTPSFVCFVLFSSPCQISKVLNVGKLLFYLNVFWSFPVLLHAYLLLLS